MLKSLPLAISSKIMRNRWLLLLLTVFILSFSIPGLFKLKVTVNMGDFFIDGDPILESQKRFEKLFSNNDFVGVLVESEDIFSRETLNTIKEVGYRLKSEISIAEDLISITELASPFKSNENLRFDNFKLLTDENTLNSFIDKSMENRLLNGVLISSNKKQAWIILKIAPYSDIKSESSLFEVGEKAYSIVRSFEVEGIRLIATGVPVYAFRKEVEMMQDLRGILVVGFIVALILSIIIFKSPQGVLGTLLLLSTSVITVFGIQGWLGISTDSAFISVPILLSMGVSIGYAIHINRYFSICFDMTGDRSQSVIKAVQNCFIPILFTAVTTIIALLSFILIKIKPVKWVGYTSAMCILAVYIFSMILFPVILSIGKNNLEQTNSLVKTHSFEPLLRRFSYWVINRQKVIFCFFAIVLIISSVGLSKVHIDFNAQKMMGNKLQHMKDQDYIGKSELGTSDTLDLVIVLPEYSFKEPSNIVLLEELNTFLLTLPLVKKSSSLSGSIKDFNWLYNRQNEDKYIIPDKKGLLRGLLTVFQRVSPDYLHSWVSRDYSTARVFIELSGFSSKEIGNNIKQIDSFINANFPDSTEYFYSGSTYQMAVMNQYITKGLVTSVLTAMLLIAIIMIIVFKSLKLGLIAMIPNILPVLVAGGIMGLFNIPLEFVTMTVVPLIIGLAVDDTIHLLLSLREEIKRTGDFEISIKRSFSVVGTAITETTIILCATFLIFTFSKVNSIIYMGILSCSGMLAAYLADIFVSPLLIRRIKKQL